MKRSELKVGESYYWSRTADWANINDGVEAKVVSLWGKVMYGTLRGSSIREVEEGVKGAGIIIEYRAPWSTDVRTVVPSAQLRGPWAKTKAAQDKAEQERIEAIRAANLARTEGLIERERLITRAASLGVTVEPVRHSATETFVITKAHLVDLLNRLEENE